ncbi:MAG: HIT domain-containing protein [Patescibacteria group bacterium]
MSGTKLGPKRCVFCKIRDKKLPANIVFENDEFLAFTPIEQVSKGHTLLIPKKHREGLLDVDDNSFERLFGVAQKLSRELIDKYEATGINLLCASGKDAQQSVMHFHLHIVPRYPNDGLGLWFKNKL